MFTNYNLLETSEVVMISDRDRSLRKLIGVLIRLRLCEYPKNFGDALMNMRNKKMSELLSKRIMKP